ncbi:MAG: hypothetical protein DHS20C21_06870 [Gemmatimonadota bacterium]|nr:MAG: hypothetical protein DHS20C21_06870 [Gemmatimonadota bacterium]
MPTDDVTRRPCHTIAGAVIVLLAAATTARGLGPESVRGHLDLTVVQSEVDGVRRNTLRQEYTANWSRNLLPNIRTRAALRYTKFDLRDNQTPDVSREEIQPSGELVWRHPQWTFSSSARRRDADLSTLAGRQINDSWAFSLITRDLDLPRVTLRYDDNHIFDRDVPGTGRDTRDKRFQAGLDHTVRSHAVSYNFTRRETDNIVSEVMSEEYGHLFQWRAPTYRPASRVTLTSNYTMSYRQQTDRRMTEGTIPTILNGPVGLYAEDSSPDLGPLTAFASLTDLNTSDPAEPSIDIGGAPGNHNLGLDLRFERAVSAVYIYTDRPSGVQRAWNVYVSDDNATWDRAEGFPRVEFNPGVNRYEVTFPTATARYVKVVDVGVNEVEQVFVTELEALQVSSEERSATREGGAHIVDGRVTYAISDDWSSTLDVSYENEPFAVAENRRERTDYTAGARYRQNGMLLHTARWQQGFESLGPDTEDRKSSTAAYGAILEPLETLRLTGALSGRWEYLEGRKSDETKSAVVRALGTPITGVHLSSEVSRSRTVQFDAGRRQDAWNYQVSADGAVARPLTVGMTYSQQRADVSTETELRVRHRYGVDFNYRLTGTVYLRGSYIQTRDLRRDSVQDYLVSWNTTPKLTMSAVASLDNAGNRGRTRRYNANITFDATSNSTLYWSFSQSDLTEAGGSETNSFQSGLRASF